MADTPKPPPLLTRPGWELATPAAASTMATSGALFGVPGIIGAGVAAAGAAGIAAARNRPKRPARAAKVKTPRQQRRATAARAGMGAAPVGGALSKLRGLAGVPRPTGGRGAGTGTASRGAGAAGRGASSSGLDGKPVGPLGRALGGLRGGAAGGLAGKRSTSSGTAAPTGSKGGSGLGVPRSKPFRFGGSSASRKPAGGSTSSGAGAARGTSSGTKGDLVKRALGKLGGSGRRGGSTGGSGGARGRGSGSGSPRSPGRSALGRLLGRGKSSGSTGTSGSSRKGSGSAGRGGSSGKTSPLRRGLQRLTGRAPKKVSLRKKRKAPRWVARIFGRKKKPTAMKGPGKPGSPVAKTAIDQALAGDKKTRRRATPSTSTAPVTAGTTTSTPTGGAMAPNPFAAVIEACGTAARAYSPDNALRVMEWYSAMPELIDAIAGMLEAQGGKTTEEFYLHPAAGEFAAALGSQFRRYEDACDNARRAFERAHEADLERIRDPRPNEAKWDIAANRE